MAAAHAYLASGPQGDGGEVALAVRAAMTQLLPRLFQRRALPLLPPKEVYDGIHHIAALVPQLDLTRRLQVRAAAHIVLSWLELPPAAFQATVQAAFPTLQVDSDGVESIDAWRLLQLPNNAPERALFRYAAPHQGRVRPTREQWFHLLMQTLMSSSSGGKSLDAAQVAALYPEPLAAARRLLMHDLREQPLGFPSPAQPRHFPPCIQRFLQKVQTRQPLNHQERFNLVAFLHQVGLKEAEIVELLLGATGFDPGMTAYQVHHISTRGTGVRENGGYQPFACRRLRDADLCPDRQCPGPTPVRRYQWLAQHACGG